MNFTIKQKMTALIAFLLGVAVLVTGLMLFTFYKINSSLDQMDRITKIQHAAMQGSIHMLKAREYEGEFFTRKDDKWTARVEKEVGEVYKVLEQLDKVNVDKKIKEHSAKAQQLGKAYVEQFKGLVATFKGGGDVIEGREELRDVINEFQPQLEDYIPKIAAALHKKASAELDSTIAKGKTIMLVVLVGSAIGQVVLLLFIVLPVLRSISSMTERLKDIATGEGDLTKRIEVSSRDEIGETAGWFNTFVENLAVIIGQVAANARQVTAVAESVRRNSSAMVASSEEMAGQAASVAVAAEEMSATAFEIASSCTRSAASAAEADQATETGARVIQETIAGMQRIAERVGEAAANVEELGAKSNQIGTIVGTIEDIADQTNMLALNAAIEAARAGEQGRGFAVVADEVRALSERTTKATKEIGDMIRMIQQETGGAVRAIENGVAEVENGTREASRSGEALGVITNEIQNVTQQMSQIATAAEEQSATTNSISQSIRQITDVVQESTDKAQDSSRSAEELSRLAEELQRLMGKFRV
ncbi:methyl-accepting chemotaxis protein [Trichlorobacter lovleyi]|uniref:Methyl-accepting chemotaxis sensory transducer n=1 Tax=Trichlorobacter lovleyi (strain ATCC BAA-1151 / DSM 17278 / SZ) TaxID=398767 RepID=B3EBH9_TRIL1|nr:methyl-accepting chemotaxis protein [Trichlorobacter lovleyi]ACD97018.1 methyl-accepting chemotaxis sensory transducer [Trichlorobacter lovleyi SZ]